MPTILHLGDNAPAPAEPTPMHSLRSWNDLRTRREQETADLPSLLALAVMALMALAVVML